VKTPYTVTPPRDGANTYLRRERDRKRRRELVVVVLAVLPLLVGLLAYIWIQLQTLAAGYRISELERQWKALSRERQQLELVAAERARPAAIERFAVDELGMAAASPEKTLYFEELVP
jgi:cell division protein FtsL